MTDNHEINALRRVALLLALLPLVVSTEPGLLLLPPRLHGGAATCQVHLCDSPRVTAVEHDLTKHPHEWQRERCLYTVNGLTKTDAVLQHASSSSFFSISAPLPSRPRFCQPPNPPSGDQAAIS